MIIDLSAAGICACCISFAKFSSDIPFFEIIYNKIILILSEMPTLWSSKMGTMFLMRSLIFSPSVSVPIANVLYMPVIFVE